MPTPTLGRPLMPEDDQGQVGGLENPGRPRMADVLATPHNPSVTPPSGEYNTAGGASQPSSGNSDGEQASGYVRLRVRLRDGELFVEDAWDVSGPLMNPKAIEGRLMWEVRAEGKRLAWGALTDFGELRGFAPPGAPEIGHHVVTVPYTDIIVRIPGAISMGVLATAELSVYEPRKTSGWGVSGPLPDTSQSGATPLSIKNLWARIKLMFYAIVEVIIRLLRGPSPLESELGRELRLVGRRRGLTPPL